MEKLEYLQATLETVKNFHPIIESEISALANKTKQAAMSGKYELFKTTNHFDSTAKNPEWVG